MRVVHYVTLAGADPVGKYLDDLPDREAAPITAARAAVEAYGLNAAGVSTRQLRGRLWELRVGAHRLLFVALAGGTVVLLHAYRKASQRAPRGEIETAIARMKQVCAHE